MLPLMVDAPGAHPRSRGENAPNQGYEAKVSGSSPLTRGKHLAPASRAVRPRLIPAHAGKTRVPGGVGGPAPAHPRSRGENLATIPVSFPRLGSSPLTRGKHPRELRPPGPPGLIPAHAGKMQRAPLGSPPPEAHPRSRGENPGQMGTGVVGAGSSPLTRGKCRGLRARPRR